MLKSPELPWRLGEPLELGRGLKMTPAHQAPGLKWAMGDGLIVWRQVDTAMSSLWRALFGQIEREGLPRWVDTSEAGLVILRGPARGEPLGLTSWAHQDLADAVRVLWELAQLVRLFHALGYSLGGLRRDEMIWDQETRTLWITGAPRLQELKHRDAEQLWADIHLIGQLLYECATGRSYPGPRQLVEMIKEREAQVISGLLMPGLVQVLASCATPYGDLAYYECVELCRDLERLMLELELPPRAHIGARSTQGNNIFRRNNQDSCGHLLFETVTGSKQAQVGFFCVADGIGGQADGERASALAVRASLEAFSRAWMSYTSDQLAQRAGLLAQGIAKVVSQQLVLEGELSPQSNRGGTTFTGFVLAQGMLGLCHVGDSAALLIREGRCHWLTREHTLATILQELGELDGRPLPKNHIAQRTISRFLTTNYEIELERVDGFDPACLLELNGEAGAPTSCVKAKRGDTFVLMSDGLSGELEDGDFLSLLDKWKGPQSLCDALVDLALERAGRDNITAMVVVFA